MPDFSSFSDSGIFIYFGAAILVIVELICIAFIASIIYTPVANLIKSFRHKNQSKNYFSILQNCDALIERRHFLDTLALLKNSFVFETPQTPELINLTKEHQQNLLARCLVVADELGSRAWSLNEVERQFINRADLQALLLEARHNRIFFNRSNLRQGLGYIRECYKNKKLALSKLTEKLHENERNLYHLLSKMFSEIETVEMHSSLVYH